MSGKAEHYAWYHRYVHGNWTVAALLLSAFSFATATAILHAILVALQLALIAWSAARLIDHRTPRDAGYFVLGSLSALITGSNSFGWSTSFAPSDIVITGFLLISYGCPLSRMSERGLVSLLALLGSLTAAFEFLTGPLPETVALIFAVWALEERSPTYRIVWSLAAFMIAFLLMFGINAGLVALAWPKGEPTGAQAHLAAAMSYKFWDIAPENEAILAQHHVSVASLKSGRLISYAYALGKMIWHSPYIVGSLVVGALVMGVIPAVLTLAWLLKFLLRRERSSLLLLLSALTIYGWHFVFVGHTIVHSNVMNRTLAWLAVIMLAGAAAEAVRWRATVRPSTPRTATSQAAR